MAIEQGGTIPAPLPLLTALLMVGALSTFASADVAVWSFSGRVAASIGLAESTTRWALGASSALALVGGTVVIWLGTRLGRLRSIAVGLCFVSACALGSTRAPTATIFLAGLVVYQAGYTFFLMSYLYGIAECARPAWATHGGHGRRHVGGWRTRSLYRRHIGRPPRLLQYRRVLPRRGRGRPHSDDRGGSPITNRTIVDPVIHAGKSLASACPTTVRKLRCIATWSRTS